jgi:tRNA modification GTPase
VSDTIAARATAPGAAAVAVIRVSGPRALDILSRLFRPTHAAGLAPWRLHVGRLVIPAGDTVDECLAVFMPAPRSYTAEDVVEFHLHGGPAVVERALELVFAAGARPAGPGEFTRRAFLAGKIDLAQAEAVRELIEARTEAGARLAAAHLSGGLSRRIAEVRETLADLLAQAEAAIDFPEDEVEVLPPAQAAAALRSGALTALERLLADCRAARPWREGAQVAICGRPNVGKSTLLNALLGRERALTSPEPGTTRDFIEETIELSGLAVRLVDTAGLREGARGIEAQGVALAEERLAAADLALAVLDAGEPLREGDLALAERLSTRPHLVVLNKADLPQRLTLEEARRRFPGAAGVLSVSALKGEGIEGLKERLASLLAPEALPAVAPGLRHQDALRRTREATLSAVSALEAGLPAEVFAAELKAALTALGEVCGETATEEILERIFSRFCIGK